ncbi:hypothetical protein ADK67_09290 [Saccharothrix sp. NRRL B-16348]|nr:hypothetical protein ADK67_09290 [Saccharothrix sp. NRRL B-16348]
MLPATATATADTGARTEAQVAQECGDDSLCLYRLPYFHDQFIEVECPPAGRCYNLPGGEHARSVLNNTYAYVELFGGFNCEDSESFVIVPHSDHEEVPPRRSFRAHC